jgi:putative ABC transport system permease protein
MLGVTPQIGRLFGPQDFALGFASVVVISDGLRRRTYGADPNVLGRTLRIDNDPYTIIGVLPRGFRHPGPTVSGDVDVFGAGGLSGDPFPPPIRGNRVLGSGIGRLKPGLTLAQAQARLTTMAAALRHDFPTDYPPQAQWTIEIQPLQETLGGQCSAHAAGVTGCGNPNRFHRIVEHCQSPLGARFGATTREGCAVSAGGEPRAAWCARC